MDALTPDQERAVAVLRNGLQGSQVSRLTGLAGTGKSWLALRLPELLGWGGATVYAAPTHRACQVLRGKARDAGVKIDTRTTWSLLRGRPEREHCQDCLDTSMRDGGICHAARPGARQDCWCVHLDPDTAVPREPGDDWSHVIVDEASMTTHRDYDDLIAKDGLRGIVLVGDPGQLPPVARRGQEWSCLTSADLPTAHLSQIQRQAEGSPIISTAWAVRNAPPGATGTGLLPPLPWCRQGAASWAPAASADAVDAWALGIGADVGGGVVLTATNAIRTARNAQARRMRWGAHADVLPVILGETVRARFNKPSKGCTKDTLGKVVGITNCDLKNGVTIADVRMETGTLLLGQRLVHSQLSMADPQQAEWLYGYCLTIHAAQGSEWDRVSYHLGGNDSREHVYTAVTRARNALVVVAS